jgi:uncharacterized protein (DUF1697 family)
MDFCVGTSNYYTYAKRERIRMKNQGYKFLALLRGINVGGKNIISKNDLYRAFKDIGYTNILTYIQSGNILFRSKHIDPNKHTEKIENYLSNQFSYNARTIVFTEIQFKSIISEAPDNWGKDEHFRHRILFPLGEVTPTEIMKELDSPKKEVETITIGSKVIYSSVSKQHISKSVLRKFSKTPVYRQVTVRNQNTIYKLSKLFEDI